MSRDDSRSKLDGVRRKLFRFRREYFCLSLSSERRRFDRDAVRSSRPDVDEDAKEQPLLPVVSGRSAPSGRSLRHDTGGPALTHGGRSMARDIDGDTREPPPPSLPLPPAYGRPLRHRGSHDVEGPALAYVGRSTATDDSEHLSHRHSLPSRCVSIPESPDEEDLADEVTPFSAADDATPDSVSDPGASVDRGASTENDRAGYNQFVRGLQSTSVTTDATLSCSAATVDVSADETVRGSTRRSINLQGTTTPCCVGRRSSEPFVGRLFGARLIRTLRKTLSAAGLGKNEETEGGGDPSAATARASMSSFDRRSSYADDVDSMLQTGRLHDEYFGMVEWQQLVVSIAVQSLRVN